jgi:hypothetical protein
VEQVTHVGRVAWRQQGKLLEMRKIMDWKTGTGSRADFLHQLRPHVLSVDRFLNDDEQALADALLLPKLPCFLVPALPE